LFCFVLFCFLKGLDPDNLKRGSIIKKGNNSLIFDNVHIILIHFLKKGGAHPLRTLPTESTNDKVLKGCRHIMYFPFTMLSRPVFFSDYLLLFWFFERLLGFFFRLYCINKIFMFSCSVFQYPVFVLFSVEW
jgi:hypothetical protein